MSLAGGRPSGTRSDAQRRGRTRRRIFVVFTLVLVLAYGRQLLSSPTAGQDFRAFYAAATVVSHAGDPYNWDELGAAEQALYNTPQHLRPGDPRYYDFLPFPEGPWLALALEPLTRFPWQAVYPVFAAIMLLAIGAGAWVVFTLLGWKARPRRVALAAVIFSPIAFFNLFQGQATAIVFLGFVAAWWLAAHDRPLLAGMALALVWVKPNLGLALPLVIVLMEPRRWLQIWLAFGGASLGAFLLATLAIPAVLPHWVDELASHWRSAQGIQPDIASLHSFYYPLLTGPLKTVALVAVLIAGAAYAFWAVRHAAEPRLRGLTLLLLWFALLPYVHSFDAILLLPLIVVLVGADLTGWDDPLTEATIWAFAVVPFGYYVGLHIGAFNGFTAIPVALLVFAWHRRFLSAKPSARVEAVAA